MPSNQATEPVTVAQAEEEKPVELALQPKSVVRVKLTSIAPQIVVPRVDGVAVIFRLGEIEMNLLSGSSSLEVKASIDNLSLSRCTLACKENSHQVFDEVYLLRPVGIEGRLRQIEQKQSFRVKIGLFAYLFSFLIPCRWYRNSHLL